MRTKALCTLVMALLASSCGPGEQSAPEFEESFVVRDSAGVRIAENFSPLWDEGLGWQVDAQPFLQIGSRTGGAQGSAFGRVGTVMRLTDGRVVVADNQALELRIFDASGEFLGSWGGPGDGPGELRRLDMLAVLAGDSVVARNEGGLRHEIYSPAGVFGRTVRSPPLQFFEGRSRDTQVAGWLPDGHFILGPVLSSTGLAPGRQLLEAEWHLFEPSGDHRQLLALLPERLVEVRGSLTSPDIVAYGPRAQAATDRTGLWHAFPASWEIRHVTVEGIDRVVRRKWTPEPVSELLADRYRSWYEAGPSRTDVSESMLFEWVMRGRLAFEREKLGETVLPLVFAESLPAFVQLVVARDDHLWIEEHATAEELIANGPGQTSSGRWTVFSDEGRWLGTVAMPEGLHVEEIGSDYVLGVWFDELEVPFVRLHRMVKP